MVDFASVLEQNLVGVQEAKYKAENYDDSNRIVFGFPTFDDHFIGMDEGTTFIAGSPNSGKSSILVSTMLRAAVKNKDVTVLDFTLDDSHDLRCYRAVGILGKVGTTQVKCPAAYPLEIMEAKEEHIHYGWEALSRISDRYLICASDTDLKYGAIETVEEMIAKTYEARPDGRVIVAVDAFDNLYSLKKRFGEKLDREEAFSAELKAMSNKYKAPIWLTGHIRKAGMRRPTMEDLKGSGGKGFDAMNIIAVYNDVSRDEEAASVYWEEEIAGEIFKRPILELNVVKNKYTDKKGITFFYFFPDQGRIEECELEKQNYYKSMVYA